MRPTALSGTHMKNPALIQSTLALLHNVESHASTAEQHDALKSSKIALHFILGRGEADEFVEYLARFNTEPLASILSFTTKEEADAWLRTHPAPPHGAVIGVEDARYHVAYSRKLEHRKLLRLPSKEEWEQMEAAGEEEEAEEEPQPPPPRHGMSFSLFHLYETVCFYLYEVEQQRMSSAEEIAALKTARIAFNFVMDMGEEHGFEDYLENFKSDGPQRPVQSFATRQEADDWLERQPEPLPPAVVAIGSERYSVGYNRRRGLRLLIRLPTPQELDSGAP